ncbi:F0F1 ATP synthase subunit A [Patescibacteria group bacterium]|nr:F0F1 ATP synthase subunit A [Patescibacteria group bacterium]
MSALPTLAAETLFQLGPLPITNSFVNTSLATLGFCLFALFFSRTIRLAPGKGQLFVEGLVEKVLEYFDKVTNDRRLSRKFLPFAGTLFLFILGSNWLGLFPGTGSIGMWQIHEGQRVFIPLLRPANSDLNLTLGLAVLTVLTSHIIGITSTGFFSHIGRFFPLGAIWKGIKTAKPIAVLIGLVECLVGVIELIAELAKMASLSLRLFGNIFAGEVLTTVVASIFAVGAPLPFIALELMVGAIQATVFTVLALVYFTLFARNAHGMTHAPDTLPTPQPAH